MNSKVVHTTCCLGCGQFFDEKWLEAHQIDECSLELLMSDTVDVPELLKQQAPDMRNNQQLEVNWPTWNSKLTTMANIQGAVPSRQKQKPSHVARPVTFRGGTYTGDMSEKQRHGFGVMTFTNGDLYTGRWFDNSRHFHGVMKYANGDEYDGNWDTGKRSGLGKLTCSNGETYSGEWVADAVFGQGVMKYANGNLHEGQWSGGKPHGAGKTTFVNGDTFTGSWVNGKRKGAGCMECADGAVIDTEWLDGVAVIVSQQCSAMKVDPRRVLKGESGSSLRSGHHCVTYANGDLYTGAIRAAVAVGPERKHTVQMDLSTAESGVTTSPMDSRELSHTVTVKDTWVSGKKINAADGARRYTGMAVGMREDSFTTFLMGTGYVRNKVGN